jgi:dihydroxy-acid dehydratase
MVSAPGGSIGARPPAVAHKCGIAFDLRDGVEVFKRTSCIADLKPAGRFVAKDLFDPGVVSPLMKTLLDDGLMHGDCVTVTGCAMAENVKCVAWNPDQDVVRPTDQDAVFGKRRGGVATGENGSGHVW